jgi:rubrerythrin
MISREEAKGIIYNEVLEATTMLATWENTEEEAKCLERFIEASNMAIEALSTERPKGRWTICGGDMHRNGRFWHCTACGKDHFVPNRNAVNGAVPSRHYELPPFCPNCGAEMER